MLGGIQQMLRYARRQVPLRGEWILRFLAERKAEEPSRLPLDGYKVTARGTGFLQVYRCGRFRMARNHVAGGDEKLYSVQYADFERGRLQRVVNRNAITAIRATSRSS